MTRPSGNVPEPGYEILPQEVLMEMLRRAHAGEDPDLIYMEHYANAETVGVPPTEDG